jgi:predicted phosphohydrolase
MAVASCRIFVGKWVMMNIAAISDCHVERRHAKSADALGRVLASHRRNRFKALVVAGDHSSGPFLEDDLAELCRKFHDTEIIFVAGNHEYYKSNKTAVRDVLRGLEARFANFHWLNRTTVRVGDAVFAGTTLWFPWNPTIDLIHRDWADFIHIERLKSWVARENEKDLQFLERIIDGNRPPGTKLVIVTHHLPTWNCVQDQYKDRDDAYTNFFVGKADRLIGGDFTWIHGHAHDAYDERLGDTRVIRNPLGYEFQDFTAFDPDKIIEV